MLVLVRAKVGSVGVERFQLEFDASACGFNNVGYEELDTRDVLGTTAIRPLARLGSRLSRFEWPTSRLDFSRVYLG